MGKSFTIALAAFAATGSFLFGYDSGVMTDVIASPNFLAFFNTTQTSSIIGAINSTFSGGGKLHLYTALIYCTDSQKKPLSVPSRLVWQLTVSAADALSRLEP